MNITSAFDTSGFPQLDPLAYLDALPDDLSPAKRHEHYDVLKQALADLYHADRATFSLATSLVKEKLGIGRPDLVASLKPLLADTEKNDGKPLPLARFPELIDLVEEEGEVRFLTRSGNNGTGVHVEDEHVIDGQVYVPPERKFIPWILARVDNILEAYRSDTPAQLYADLVAYYQSMAELPTDGHYDLVTAFTFHTYTLDFPDVTHSPELVLDAVPERGKSRTGKAITHVVMRGLRTETLREANIFRWSEDLGATLFFDVLNLWKKAEREKSEDLFLNRFERGAKAARVLNPDKGRFEDTRYFDIFGATIIATNESVHKILDTRCLTIAMPPATKRFDTEPTPELGLPFRERLLAWRAQQMGRAWPELTKAYSGRFGDITLPLLKIIRLVAPDREEALRALFDTMEKGRLNEKSRTLEADILTAMFAMKEEVRGGKVALKKIAEVLNEDRTEKEQLTPRFIAAKVRSLGFQLTSRNPADIVWNAELLEQCLIGYGIQDSPCPPETSSQSSQSSQPEPEMHGERESFETVESIERQNAAGSGAGQWKNEAVSRELF
ncbi:MAG: hypothetical protein HYZ50_05215 [Deltaproteobacteria bacterium]|nr:hypothetical protein [Deltaproteobacteria bacterium]